MNIEPLMLRTPRVKQNNKSLASIDDYFQDAAAIWERDLQERSVFDLWLHVVDHAARVVEAVRKEKPIDVIDDLADTTMWLFSFLAQCRYSNNELDRFFHLDVDPSDIIWHKYPGMCPACLDFRIAELLYAKTNDDDAEHDTLSRLAAVESDLVVWSQQYVAPVPCLCLSRVAFAEERHELFHDDTAAIDGLRIKYATLLRDAGHKPTSVSDIEGTFTKIFRNSYSVLPLESIAFHLLEEVGEVTQALKDCYTYDSEVEPWSVEAAQQRNLKLQEEIADVFSWLFAILLKIKSVYEDAQKYIDRLLVGSLVSRIMVSGNVTFSELIWSKYGRSRSGDTWEYLKCPRCEARPCSCPRDLLISWGDLRSSAPEAP